MFDEHPRTVYASHVNDTNGHVPPISGDWVDRERALHSSNEWDDDLDMLDGDERVQASELVNGAPGALTPVIAAQVLAETRAERRWVNPYESLLDELRRCVAYVMMLEVQIRDLDANGGAQRTIPGRSLLKRYNDERDRQIKVATECIRLGIAERTIRLVEREVEDLARMVATAAVRANLPAEQRRTLMLELAAEVRARARRDVIEAHALTDVR